jgi:hypothetical protein
VLEEFSTQQAKVWFTEDDEMIEAFGSYRSHEAFGVRVAIWAAGRDCDALDAAGLEKAGPVLGEQRVAVVNDVRRAAEKSVRRIEALVTNRDPSSRRASLALSSLGSPSVRASCVGQHLAAEQLEHLLEDRAWQAA